MKFLAVLLLASFGLAAASNVLSESFGFEVQLNDEPEVFYEVHYGDGNDDAKSLRKRLEELMEIVKEHRDYDKRPPKETLLEMKKIFEDMEKNNIELTTVEQIVKWALNYYIELPDSPHGVLAHEDPKTELSRILKKHFEEILEKVKDMIEDGKTYKEDLGEKLKEIAQKLKDMKVDISDHAKELLKKLKDKAKDYWKKIIDKITPGSEPLSADDAESLRKRLDELMEKLRENQAKNENPAKEILLEMKKIFDDMENKNIELTTLEQIIKSTVEFYLKIERSHDLVAHEDPKTELAKILKKHFDEILEKVRDMIENGKAYKEDLGEKLKEIAQKLKDMKVDISDHAKELLNKLKDKAKDYWKKIIDKITPGSEPFSSDDVESLRKRLDELLEFKHKDERPTKEVLLEMKKIFDDMESKNIELTTLEQIIKSTVEFYLKLKRSHDLVTHEDPKTELAKMLKKHFDEILEKVRDMIENGKAYKEDLGEKLKEIAQKLKDMKVDISDHAKELLNKLKDKAKDYWKKIIDKLTPGSEPFAAEDEDYSRNLRERFEEILEKIKDAIENRKSLGGNVVAKLKEIYQEMRKKSIPFGDKVKELLEEMKEKATGIWKRILDNINLNKRSVEARGTGAENLRERLEELLTKLKESFRDRKLPGKGFISKLKQIREEMRQNKVPLGGKLKEMIEKLKENANGVWRRILDRIGRNNSPSASEEGEDYARNLRERFEEILEKIKDAIENRKSLGGNVVAKLKEIYQEMKKKSIPFGDKVKELLEEMKEKATGIWKRILDNINLNKRSVEARGTGAENLRERLEELLTKLKESFRDRKFPGRGFISKLKQIREEMRQNKVPLGGKLKEMIEKLKENANGVWRRILDRLGRKSSSSSEEDQYARNLRTRLNEILEMVKDGFVTRTTIGGQYLYHLETVWNEMKEKSIPAGERAIQLIQELKKMTNGEWKALLYKLLPDEE